MGKRRSKGRSSTECTPHQSESSGEDVRASVKKGKIVKKSPKEKPPKSSAEICEELGMEDVELEFTEADYQNLTTFSLFSRMVRPQLVAANPKSSSAYMIKVMEAKWREYGKAKVASDKRRKEEAERLERIRKEAEKLEEPEEDEEEEEEPIEAVEDDDDFAQLSDEEEEEVEIDRKSSKSKAPKRTPTLTIKMPLLSFRKKSGRDRKPIKSYLDDENDSSASEGTSKRKRVFADSESESDEAPKKSRSRQRVKLMESSDDDLDDGRRRSGRARKKVKVSESNEESDLSGEDSNRRKKKSKPKRTQPAKSTKSRKESSDNDISLSDDSDDDDDDDSDSDDSDDSSDNSGPVKRRKKASNQKPKIPGERKSDRKRNVLHAGVVSDKEFEKMMLEDAKKNAAQLEEKRRKAAAKKREEKRNAVKAERQRQKEMYAKKKGDWQEGDGEKSDRDNAEEKDDGNESDHLWFCELCKDGGDLLLCDTCPNSFHKECLKLEDVPDGDWSCPVCTGEGLPEEGDTDDEIKHDQFCKVCKDGGDVILCDYCPCVFHLECLNPQLKEAPDGEWKCPRCIMAETPMKAKVKNILTWRWSHQRQDVDEFDHTHSPQKKISRHSIDDKPDGTEGVPNRELLVRYEYHSYWDCEWVPELQLEVHVPTRWQSFKKKFDMDEPPALEDGSSYGKMRHKQSSEKDPFNLEERFYRWGIKPEWLLIQRIIAHEGKGSNAKYLVKWCDLGYEDCTWEYLDDVEPGVVEDLKQHVDKYWERRKEYINGRKRKGEKPKNSLLKKKLEKQPSYMTNNGGRLHPYQMEGLNWMRFSYSQNTNTILADEMGLGKTIQAIAIIYSLWKEGYCNGPFLIAAPLSTVPNWEREFTFWAPDMYVVTYTGFKESRMVLRERDFCYKEGAFHYYHKPCKMKSDFYPKFDVLLTSYEFINSDVATLASINWDVVIIDEAHRLKNNQSLFFQTLSAYKVGYKLLLTGTPLQNNLEELFNLLNFLEPGKFVNVEEFLEEFDNVNKEMQVARLHEMLAPHMLRRLKSDVLSDIPDKTELIVRVELCPMQKKYYKYILTKNYEALNVRGFGNQTSLKNIMVDLRKCCNHPYLFPAADNEAPLSKSGAYEGSALVKSCGKLLLLEKMLIKLKRDGHRVLLFSQMTKVLDIIEEFMAYMQLKYERIDGNVNSKLRQEAIDRFNSDESESFVFLLSTRAGGLGINLATADTVIIYDMDWNPHNDIQAFSRAHRIGQKNKVMIYRFVSRNTVEERMAKVCKQKMMLTELVIHKGLGAEKKESLTKQEVSEILRHGAEELFKDEEGKAVVYDDAAVEALLNRDQKGDDEGTIDKDAAVMGMNEYLRSFKVASYQLQGGKEEVEEEEDKDEIRAATANSDIVDDAEYWKKVLGESYQEFAQQQIAEAVAIASTLGKGKRVRRKVNYAEQQALLELEAKKKREKVVEDATYLTDYEPSTSGSEQKKLEEDDDDDEGVAEGSFSRGKYKAKKQQHHKQAEQAEKLKEMPPLLAKVDGRVEVLGFSARQRRAFLDLVMKYGLPHDDIYNSPWRSRDLKDKSEKILKAYTSLFMRHLCEPIEDDADKFSDGVPREGLSRQHVLTRIGMIALIRKKVAEFESKNGYHSMKGFNVTLNPVSTFRRGQLSKPCTDKSVSEISRLLNINVKQNTENTLNEEKKSLEKLATEIENLTCEVTEGNVKPTDENGKPSDENGKCNDENGKVENENVKADDESVKTKDENEKAKEENVKTNDENVKANDENVKANDEDVKAKEEKACEESKCCENVEPSEENVKENEEKNKDSVNLTEEERKENKESADAQQKDDNSNSNTDKETGESLMEIEEKANDAVKDSQSASKSDKMETNEKELNDNDDDSKSKEETDVKSETISQDIEMKDEIEETEGKSQDTKADKDTEEGGKNEDVKDKEKKEDSAKPATTSAVDVNTNDDVIDLDKETPSTSQTPDIKSPKAAGPPKKKPYSELFAELRDVFWIADGGFTELHAFWQLEETSMETGLEYQTWHRRHDFWLLAGVATHGYRHWQDILTDPRFEILSHVFRSEEARMKKAAFLNRRFQVLEQALVIEEQLRKAVEKNQAAPGVREASERGDQMTAMDKMASHLRKVNQTKDKSTVDKKSIKALNQVGSLVLDIKTVSFSSMPATLIRTPQLQPTIVQGKRPPIAIKYGGVQGSQKYVSTMLASKRSVPSAAISKPQPKAAVPQKGSDVICLD